MFHIDPSTIEYNYGYRFLEAIYDKLDITSFFKTINFKGEYSLNEIFKYLVFQRILNPDSKRATFQNIQSFYRYYDNYTLDDLYRALDVFNKYKVDLQKYINDKIKEIVGRDNSYAYYDVTNYYNEIDYSKDENDLRQRGVSKEHRVDPIIQLGLFIDSNGLPISMSLFKGNTSDTKTLQPVMAEIKKNYNLKRLIVVADKGLNSTSNINYIVNNNDGYVVSQILKGKKGQRYQKQLFTESNYIYNNSKTFKYQLFEEDYEIINSEGKKETKRRKVLIYWKLEDAIAEVKKRDDKLSRALKSLGNNAYAIRHTYEQYIKEMHTVEETGEIANKVKRVIDEESINEDIKYDGYFCIITNEVDYDYEKILKVYGDLWKIEESFRISKSDLEVRPIYVNTESHINGHFLICYVALVIIRLLQLRLKSKLSVERIVKALNSCKCTILEKGIIHLVRGTITKSYQQVVNKQGQLVSTTKLVDNDERIQDLLNIIESFNSYPFFSYSMQNDFNNYLESIKY